MTDVARIKGRVAQALVAHATRVAAPEHAEWIEAISHELWHLPSGEGALSWAMGCVLVSYSVRVRALLRSPLRWPRWLILLEICICLGPVTAYFVLISLSTVQGYVLFLPTQGLTQIQEGLIFGSAALIGPVGLLAAGKTLFSEIQGPGRWMTAILLALLAWALAACLALFGYLHLELAPWFGMYFLPFVLLPAVGVAHLAGLDSVRHRAAALT